MTPLPPEFSAVYFSGAPPSGGWPRRFSVVTAYNPDGRLTEPDVNLAADLKLRGALEELELPHFRVIGGSLDGRHQEPGWGIVLNEPATPLELSRRFRQLAFFWVEQDRIILIDARTGVPTPLIVLWPDRWIGPDYRG